MNLKKKCDDFISGDGCSTLPVLVLIIFLLIWMMGGVVFSFLLVTFVIIRVRIESWNRKKKE